MTGLPASRRSGPDCLSDLQLDQLILAELTPAQVQTARAHLAACAACAQARARLEADHGAFARSTAVAGQVDALLRRAAATRGPGARPAPAARWRIAMHRFVLVPAGVAAVLAALFLGMLLEEPGGGATGPYLARAPEPAAPTGPRARAKGGFALAAYRQPRGQLGPGELLVDGRVGPGDRLRFVASSDRAGYLAVLAVDSAGVVSVYYPDGEVTATIGASTEEPLPSAVELDQTLGPETVIALRCARATPVEELVAAVRIALSATRTAGRAPHELGPVPTPCDEARLALVKVAAQPLGGAGSVDP